MALSAISPLSNRSRASAIRQGELRAILGGMAAYAGAALTLKVLPQLELQLFARAAAAIVSLLTGYPVVPSATGWMLPLASTPIVVSVACSAVGYFTIVVALIAWQLGRAGKRPLFAAALGLAAALPVTLFVNAIRIVTVAQAHRSIIPRFPAHYDAFLHMATGVAVFLPSLIALNLVLETYGRHRSSARSAA